MAAPKKLTKTAAKPKAARPKAARKATTTAIARAATPKSPTTRKGSFDLVIVESPAKAKTINKYLGSNFKVLASYGHVRDLPRRRQKGEDIAGVKIKGWIPTYVVEDRDDSKGGRASFKRKTSKQILAELGREASKAGKHSAAVQRYLETGDDRALRRFKGKYVVDAEGNRVPLLTDTDELDRLGSAGELSFESLYVRSR